MQVQPAHCNPLGVNFCFKRLCSSKVGYRNKTDSCCTNYLYSICCREGIVSILERGELNCTFRSVIPASILSAILPMSVGATEVLGDNSLGPSRYQLYKSKAITTLNAPVPAMMMNNVPPSISSPIGAATDLLAARRCEIMRWNCATAGATSSSVFRMT